MFGLHCVLPGLLCLGIAASAEQARPSLADRLTPLIKAHEGDVAVCVQHLDKDDVAFAWRGDAVMPTASLIKLAVMITAYQQADAGTVDLDGTITLRDADKVPGSGILTRHFSEGTTISLRDAIRLMMAYSDNTATNLVLDAIGLPATRNAMKQLGLKETTINSKVYRGGTSIDPERSREFGLGTTTARETVRLLAALHAGSCASDSACDEMIEHLARNESSNKIAAGLPAGTRFAHKTGGVSAVRCDAGIIYSRAGPIAVCVLTSNNKDRSWKDDNQAHVLCARIGRAAHSYFNPGPARTVDEQGPLKSGDFGTLVESLQRTLNARLDPSPDLSVDGDFGPATEAAVRRFQEHHKLGISGIVEQTTWNKLGPLVGEKPQPDPQAVNSATSPRRPEEPLSAPPTVTCKAWTIIDRDTGEVLGSHNAAAPLDNASTTKIMTGWLVLQLTEADPDVLDETITFSARADRTRGSTSGLRAGESVSVREALYGLFLPSGNDMSIALAEHFGSRLAPGDSKKAGGSGTGAAPDDADPVQQFVAAMNAEAERLGLMNTQFRNPHGLTANGHHSTADDLARLARLTMENKLFRSYVATRQRGVRVHSTRGYSRNVVWKNTNRLLRLEGYEGVKTGTTTRAGACLVSAGERDGERLIVVILGSSSSDARYADTRNLYRWAWTQIVQRAVPAGVTAP